MTDVGETDSSLATKCLALCQALTSQGMVFNFSLNIGSTFSFLLDTKRKEALSSKVKKKASPSTLRRNMRRREEFFNKKKSKPSEAENSDSDKEASQSTTFPCDQCENVSKNEKGLKIHKGKAHKTVEKVRMGSSDPSLTVSPTREGGRIIPCHNCGEDMSPFHLCQEGPSEMFKCECEEEFNFEVELENHKQTVGGCPKQFVCPVCNVDCIDLDGRWKHEFEVHPDSEVCLDFQEYLDFNSDL